MAEIKKVGVLGAGMMGSDISLVCAMAGYDVLMKEINLELAQAGHDKIAAGLTKWIEKGKIKLDDAGKQKILDSIKPTDSYDGFEDVDLVIEAIIEDIPLKEKTFQELEKICKPTCIIASNTSSISITKLGACFSDAGRAAKFVGTHFFSPASIMKLVEVIKGEETSEETMDVALNFCKSIDKEPIRVVDCVGFVINRILYALNNEAIRLYEEGIASLEDIDKGCRLGLGHPVGPFALMDITANDLNLKVGKILHEGYGDRFHPRPTLVKKVDAGHFGRKTGKGWFDYSK
ncbi:3-hydroxyacyl-CoA dehydrogenase family protein [Thermodesulfobacteriota bacterium]